MVMIKAFIVCLLSVNISLLGILISCQVLMQAAKYLKNPGLPSPIRAAFPILILENLDFEFEIVHQVWNNFRNLDELFPAGKYSSIAAQVVAWKMFKAL